MSLPDFGTNFTVNFQHSHNQLYMIFGLPVWVSPHKNRYIYLMFVRKKKNPGGIVSVQIIDKSKGLYHVVKTIGSSSDISTIESLYIQGKKWISTYLGEQDKVLNIAKTIRNIKINLPKSGDIMTKTMLITQRQKNIAQLFDEKFGGNI
jgi:hypothetical protein